VSVAQGAAPHPVVNDDGVRVLRHSATAHLRYWGVLVLVLAGFAVLVVLLHAPARRVEPTTPAGMSGALAPPPSQMTMQQPPDSATKASPAATPVPVAIPAPDLPPQFQPPTATADDWPSSDLNDIARYISPGDPEPTAAELIHALRETGEYGGIAAFNPPGTSPPLIGIAVPEDYDLPAGYVRHYQATDDGQPIEAILMYAPDHRFFDDQGNEIEVPVDRVVPADRLPAGLLPRAVEIPAAE
jgi:hypothetical protein